jgi:hypothetical protein
MLRPRLPWPQLSPRPLSGPHRHTRNLPPWTRP